MATTVRTRFAPSPTGYLHLGNLRTALFNVLAAKAQQGDFVLRVEDTDTERSRPEWAQALYEDLQWLGIDWQEGPQVGGGHGPYQQSERADIYQRYFDQLIDQGQAYPCFCTPQELAASRKAQLAAGQPPRYRGTCAHLNPDDVAARVRDGQPSALRFRVPGHQEVSFTDIVCGPQRFATGTIGDFIIRRTNGTAAFFFSNAIDDALMGMTHVLRGDDHLTNTPRQLLIMAALDLTPPQYGHLGLLTGHDGAPLSKRHGSASVRDLRAQAILPIAVLNYLARLGHHYEHETGLRSFADLTADFNLNRLSTSPACFDEQQLQHWQHQAIETLTDDAFSDWVDAHVPQARKHVPEAQWSVFIATVRHNIKTPHDVAHWAQAIFAQPEADSDAREAIVNAGADFFAAALTELGQHDDFKPYAKAVGQRAGVKGKQLYMPLRAALTGSTHGPEMARMWALLGTVRIRTRLKAAQQPNRALS